MNRALTVTLSVLIVLLIGLSFLFIRSNIGSEGELAEEGAARSVSQEAVSVASRLERSEAEKSVLEEKLSVTRARIAELEAEIAAAVAATEDAVEEADTPVEDEVGGGETSEDDKPTLDEIRERLRNNATAGVQGRALMEMAYGEFFGSLELDSVVKASLRDLLLDRQMEQLALAGYAMQMGDVTGREFAGWEAEESDRLAEQVRALLSDDEFEAWAEYEAGIDERAMDANLRNQIRMFSSGLTPENHDVVVQVAVEEFLAEQNSIWESDALYDRTEAVMFQIRAMDSMRVRLTPLLSEDQFQELENFLTMAENMLRAALPEDETTAQ